MSTTNEKEVKPITIGDFKEHFDKISFTQSGFADDNPVRLILNNRAFDLNTSNCEFGLTGSLIINIDAVRVL